MTLFQLLEQIKKHPEFHLAGMVLCHNGVVRGTSRDGRKVSGLRVAADHQKLNQVIDSNKKLPGILEILVHINENKDLLVGDDVMYLVVAGDVRENVISALQDTLNEIKSTVTQKTEYFSE
jgi:molybdopterin synthase catalytic subunit